jgi:hypothetical protein
MRRFDLLRSPLLWMSLALLLLNDFLLKAAFHNWVTGKLSDFAGLVAFSIFCCAIWPRHVWLVGAGVSAFFVFWKSPCSQALIDLANLVLPFQVGRTVDYGDLVALPVAWLVCGHADRLPLLDIGKLGVWLTGGLCLFAFTATSRVEHHYSLSRVADTTQQADPVVTEAKLQSMFDEVAARHGMRCTFCDPLANGRAYRSSAGLSIAAGFDVRRRRVLFSVGASGGKDEVEKTRPQTERIRAEIEGNLKAGFPALMFSDDVWQPETRLLVEVSVQRPEEIEQASAIVSDVMRASRLEWRGRSYYASADGIMLSPLRVVPELSASSRHSSDESKLIVSLSAFSPEQLARLRQIADDLVQNFRSAFGAGSVSVRTKD